MDLLIPGRFKHNRPVGLREGAASKPWLRARAQLREDHEALEKVEVSRSKPVEVLPVLGGVRLRQLPRELRM